MDNVFQKTMVIPATNIKQILLQGFKLKILNKHGSYNARSSLIHWNVLSGTHVRKWYSDQDDVIRTIIIFHRRWSSSRMWMERSVEPPPPFISMPDTIPRHVYYTLFHVQVPLFASTGNACFMPINCPREKIRVSVAIASLTSNRLPVPGKPSTQSTNIICAR